MFQGGILPKSEMVVLQEIQKALSVSLVKATKRKLKADSVFTTLPADGE
jgi:hypothetical protein